MAGKITKHYNRLSDQQPERLDIKSVNDLGLSPMMKKPCNKPVFSFLRTLSHWQLLAIVWLFLVVLWLLYSSWLLKPQVPDMAATAKNVPQECRYLKHYFLDAELYQSLETGRMACISSIRYFGYNKRHGIRYSAFGHSTAIEEMRLSLRMSQYDLQAIKELIRFGNSLALPVMGHTLPVEVGQVLQSNENSQWQYGDYQVKIERQNLNAQAQDVHLIILTPASGFNVKTHH